jgi:hypothetical protein
MDRTRRYRESFLHYLQAKNALTSYSWLTPTPPEEFRTEDELVEARTGGEFKTSAEYEAWASRQTDVVSRWRKLYKVKRPGDGPEDFPFLDISDMPQFVDQPPALFAGLEPGVLVAGVLIIEVVLLFYVGYVAFLRFDVR